MTYKIRCNNLEFLTFGIHPQNIGCLNLKVILINYKVYFEIEKHLLMIIILLKVH